VSVVGNAASGKSHPAERIATVLEVPCIELDAVYHLANWEPIGPEVFAGKVGEITMPDGSVVDGNYRNVEMNGPVLRPAGTVVWLDPPLRTVRRRVIVRTLRRTAPREALWNANKEPLRNLWLWGPDEPIIRRAWSRYAKYQERYRTAMASPAFSYLAFVRSRSAGEAERWLSGTALSH